MPEERKERKIFIIDNKKTRKQQIEFESVSVPLRHLPENLAKTSLTCPFCKTQFSPDWFKKHGSPLIPVKPKYESKGIPYEGPARWILHQSTEICPKCKSCVMINVPANKIRAKGSLFGDDAERIYKNKKVFIYSLVGIDQHLISAFEAKIRLLKQSLIPSRPADEWKIHMKDLWSGSNRERHPVYKHLNFSDVIKFIKSLLLLIKESNIFIYNIAITIDCRLAARIQISLRREAYVLLLMNTIDEWTLKYAQPSILFDSEKDSKADKIIHNWASIIFKSSQYSLLYAFLSRGIEVPEPRFVTPASYPLLEIADFVSYTIARYYYKRWIGSDIDIDPMDMGLVSYLGYDFNGDLLIRRAEGYPWDYFKH